MPSVFVVNFSREFEINVIAESKEEAQKAAAKISDWDLDHDYNPPKWDRHAYVPTYPVSEDSADHGVLEGEIVAIEDYREAMKEREDQEPGEETYPPDTRTLPLPHPAFHVPVRK